MTHPFYGFGLGLRTQHYLDFEAARQRVDWLEIITDNFLVAGGKPLHKLMRFRQDYPIAMHGVAMSIGSAAGLDLDYVRQVHALAKKVEPMWISDHLCWGGSSKHPMHDLYPLPYTEECAALIISHIRTVQDILERRFVVENVSSYMRFSDSQMSEWAFLAHIIEEADCDLLLDVNNIYVSSVNHGFDPLDYLNAIPKDRVRQIHLAGHSMTGEFIIDTHDHPIIPAVWSLYGEACKRFAPTATMIERDDHIPPLPELIAELDQARAIAQASGWPITPNKSTDKSKVADAQTQAAAAQASLSNQHLDHAQEKFATFVLTSPINTAPLIPTIIDAGDKSYPDEPKKMLGEKGLAIYHNAYRVRLIDVLLDSYEHLVSYMGDYFGDIALTYVERYPSESRNLGRYGHLLPSLLSEVYPNDPVLKDLAQLVWSLRTRFEVADVPAWTMPDIEAEGAERCLSQSAILHPSIEWLSFTTNAIAIWRAIEDDVEVPPAENLAEPVTVLVWRQDLRPHFLSLSPDAAKFMRQLQSTNASINHIAEQWIEAGTLESPEVLAGWLRQWWELSLLAKSAQAISQ